MSKGFGQQQSDNEQLLKIQWESYRREVVPGNASQIQLQETRRAFYAGAAQCFGIVSRINADDEAEAVRVLSALEQEIKDYVSQVGKGF